jgi:two-component system, NarL family, vancomycin resistance associated response regulator VraR
MLSYRSSQLRVLIVDDHELIRFSLKLALMRQPHIEIVGLASNGQEAIDMVKQHHPDVVILDLQMPIVDGLSASNQIKSLYPQTRIVAYSSVKDPQVEVMIQTAQVDAFCEKEVPIQELIDVVTNLGRESPS